MKKTKKEPKPHATYWRDKADAEITRLHSGRACVVCGTCLHTCGHHLIPRSRSSYLRHDLRNIFVLCPSHHMFSNTLSAHSENALAVREFANYIEKNFPDRLRYLIENQHVTMRPDYKAAYERLRTQTENYTDR